MAYKVLTDYTFTLERETSFGVKKDTSPLGLPTENMEFVQNPNVHVLNRAWGYRGEHESNTWNDTFATIPTATLNMIMTPQILNTVLPGVLQNSSNWSGTGASSAMMTMYSNNYSNLPSPKSTGDGYFFTLTRNSPVSGDDEAIISAIPKSLKLMIAPTDNEGVMMGEFEFLGKSYERQQNLTGSITHASLSAMYQWGNIKKVSFGAYNFTTDFVSAEINITNGAKLVNDIPEGEYVFPKWEVEWTFKVIANANTEAMKTLVLNNTVNNASDLRICFGNASSVTGSGDLHVISNAYLTEWSSDFTEGEVIEFKAKGVFGTSGKYPILFSFHKG